MKCQILFSRKNKKKYFKMSAKSFYPACKASKSALIVGGYLTTSFYSYFENPSSQGNN